MKALVTGITGFLGTVLAPSLLNDGFEKVYGLSRSYKDSNDIYRFDLINGNIEVLKGFMGAHRITHVFHFAADPLVKNSSYKCTEANALMTHRLLDACPDSIKFIFASSATVYDFSFMPPAVHPGSIYGENKLFSENIIKHYFNEKKIADYLIIRYVAHVGKSSTHGLCHDIVKKLRSDNPVLELYGQGPGALKPLLYLEDSMALTARMAKNTTGVVNMSPGDNITVESVAYIIMGQLGIHKPIKWIGASWAGDDQYVKLGKTHIASGDPDIRNSYEAVKAYADSL